MSHEQRVSLNGEWEFREAAAAAWRKGQVPGCVQLDLLRLGEVPDPYYRMDEMHLCALEDQEWVYRREFSLDAEQLVAAQVELVFEGIDTLADVYLNGQFVGQTQNMFIPYRFDVTGALRAGRNEVEVRLASIMRHIKNLEAKSPLRLHSSCESARPYIRKAQYAFGWDWGPRIVQVGLWRPVYLEFLRAPKLCDPFFYTEKLEAERAAVRVSAEVRMPQGLSFPAPETLRAKVTLSIDGADVATAQAALQNRQGQWGVDAHLSVPNPQLWWPNGMGEQPLYTVCIELLDDLGIALDGIAFRSGIRTIRLAQEADVEGHSFVFHINGEPLFAKGANWIPADNLLPRLTREDYFDYIRLAREANMNMLRIWGGGIYEDAAFYEACDEFGILVWQDFMYSCAQYPDELGWFQALARQEAEAVVKRLRNHPSLALWCGNNENNWGFDEWWHNGVPKYLGNYVYREILPQVCATHDPSRPYWVSSPYGGDKPNSMSDGDRHSWSVWSAWQDYGGYLKDTGRFISEFGFQAMPTWKTVLAYTAPEDRRILSPVIISHNKMTEGMERLTRFLVGRIGFPKDLKSFVYLTQFNQAEAIKTGVEHWRLRKFMTSGALYWQLNDCWPVASWSSLDYFRRKKGLYYYTQRFFSQLYSILKQEGDAVALYGVSDLPQAAQAQVRLAAYTLDGRKLAEFRRDVRLEANRVTRLAVFSLAELGIGARPRVLPRDGSSTTHPRELNGALLDSVVYVELSAGGQSVGNYMVFGRFRELCLQSADIRVTVAGDTITLCAAAPAFGVFIETEADVDLSDNCLNLEPNVPVVIRCAGEPGAVEVRSLVDMVASI